LINFNNSFTAAFSDEPQKKLDDDDDDDDDDDSTPSRIMRPLIGWITKLVAG